MRAVEACRSGDTPSAEQHLAASLGVELTPIMKDSLKTLCDMDNPNEAVVTLLVNRLRGG